MKLIITIDGPAGSGKSTIAQLLAEKLNAAFLDTGAMYRAVTLAAIQDGADMKNEQKLLDVLNNSNFRFTVGKNQINVSIDGVDVTEQIRQPNITANARHIASAPKLRKKLVQMQRDFAAAEEKVVTEGRDQGTVAFPDADVKFFLTADADERAKRRQAQLNDMGKTETLDQIKKAIEQRDQNDRSRAVGPLKPADDAIIVDTTDLTKNHVVEKLLHYVEEKCLKKD